MGSRPGLLAGTGDRGQGTEYFGFQPSAISDQPQSVPRPSSLVLRLLASLLSGAAYALAFPPYHQAWLAWVALVPLLLVARGASPRAAFGYGYLAGLVAFGWTIEWVRHVTVSGWIVLSLYLALYPSVWVAAVAYFEKRRMSHVACRTSEVANSAIEGVGGILPPASCLLPLWLSASALWTLLEWLRGWLFTGFGWALLAYSQWRLLPVIQIAHLVTAYGVSFLVVLVNATVAELLTSCVMRRASSDWWPAASLRSSRRGQPHLLRFVPCHAQHGRDTIPEIATRFRGTKPSGGADPVVAAKQSASVGARPTSDVLRLTSVALVLTLAYGAWRLSQPIDGEPLTVAVIQGNIPQAEKWDERYAERILAQYDVLTRVVSEDQPDLVIWPETAVPGYLEEEPQMLEVVRRAAVASGGSLLVGAPAMALEATNRRVVEGDIVRHSTLRYYNRAILLGPDGTLRQRYDKVHLVPFGEYVPFERYLPQIRRWIPPTGDFTRGEEYTVFELGTKEEGRSFASLARTMDESSLLTPRPSSLVPRPSLRFGVLICYEDSFPWIVRRLRQNGAQFLVNITNDAWFGRSSGAADQHAQASLFRAIEEGVWMVRAANTGYSCVIDPHGRIVADVRDRDGRRLFVPGYAVATLRVSR